MAKVQFGLIENSIGRKKHFGQMVILLVALEKYHQQLYKNILKVRDNRYDLRKDLFNRVDKKQC